MTERRTVTRTTISRDAKLFFNSELGTSVCSVRDVTNVGAGIRTELKDIPESFELSFDNFYTSRKCRMVWQNGHLAGATFN